MEDGVEKKGKLNFKIVLITLLVLILAGAGAYFGYSKFLKGNDKSPNVAAQNSTSRSDCPGGRQQFRLSAAGCFQIYF